LTDERVAGKRERPRANMDHAQIFILLCSHSRSINSLPKLSEYHRVLDRSVLCEQERLAQDDR